MKKLFSVAGFVLCVGAPAWALAALPGPVVDEAWLAQNLANVTVLDVGNSVKGFAGKPQFETDKKTGKSVLVQAAGHIPGAVLVDPKDMRADRTIDGRKVQFMIPEKADFEKLAQRWGVPGNMPIVIVPMGASTVDMDDAARLYWQFKYYGENNVALLNGGTIAWITAGHAVASTPAAAPAAGNWTAKGENKAVFADSEAVEKAVASKSDQLVDARDLAFFYGLTKKPIVSAAGHIPGARAVPAELLTKPGDNAVFLQPEQYRAMLAGQGIDPDKAAITYCNTGHLASGVWFVMSEILGNKSTRLYDGSMHEWTLEKRKVVSN